MQDGSDGENDTPAWSRGHRPGSTIKKRFVLQSRELDKLDHEDEVEDFEDEDQVRAPDRDLDKARARAPII